MTVAKRQTQQRVLARRRAFLCALAGLLALLGAQQALAQAPAAAAPAAPAAAAPPTAGGGAQFYRLTFLEFDQYSFQNHPFFQITGDSDFKDGDAATAFTSVNTPVTAGRENLVLKGLHSLPPFGIEAGQRYDFIFPKAWSYGFDYHRFSQTDVEALDTTKSVVTIPRISMDMYLYSFFVRGYAFDAEKPGINYYIGFGLGMLEGKFDAIPYAGAQEQRVGFHMTPIGMTQLGVEARGDSFGVRYEVRLVRARKVELDKNPFLDQQKETVINFTGSLIKLTAFYQF
jgi:hypothetical protein